MATEQEIQKYIQQVQDASDERMTRYLGALKEDVNDKIQVVAEMVAHNTEQIAVLKENVETMHQDIGIMKSDIDIMKSDISIIKTDLREKVGHDELIPIERRVVLLESKSKK